MWSVLIGASFLASHKPLVRWCNYQSIDYWLLIDWLIECASQSASVHCVFPLCARWPLTCLHRYTWWCLQELYALTLIDYCISFLLSYRIVSWCELFSILFLSLIILSLFWNTCWLPLGYGLWFMIEPQWAMLPNSLALHKWINDINDILNDWWMEIVGMAKIWIL